MKGARYLLAVCLVLFGISPAAADTWKARNKNMPEVSPGGCARAQDGFIYTIELVGQSFTLTGDNGRFFAIAVPPDGTVKHEFKSPNGGRFEISGNVKSRDLVFKNLNTSCSSKLVPI